MRSLQMKWNEMKDFVRFYFEYPTSKAADKSWNVNQSQNPHIWQCQILIDFRTRQTTAVKKVQIPIIKENGVKNILNILEKTF